MAPPSFCTSPFKSARVADTFVAALVMTVGGLGLTRRVMIRAEGSLSSRLPKSEPSEYSNTRLIEAVVATDGVPEITPVLGLTVKPSGNPKAAKPVGEPVADMV